MTKFPSPELQKIHADVQQWKLQDWLAAWGYNAPVVADEYDDRLPKLPDGYEWQVLRDVVVDDRGPKPKMRVVLLWVGTSLDDMTFRVVDRGVIDVQLYGADAVIELARNIKQRRGLQ